MPKFTIRDILSETNADKLNYYYCVTISKNGDGTSKIVWKHAKISETGLSIIRTEDVIIPLVLGITCIENSFTDDIRYYLDNEVLKDRSGAYYYRALPIY